jgi:hypothetical protein
MGLKDDLKGYWPLNEASGNALDAHGSNTLTDNNTVASAAGKVGNARDFESGNSESFSIADNTDLSVQDIPFTIAAWVNFESFGAIRPIVAKWQTAGQFSYELAYSTFLNRLFFGVSNDGSSEVVVAANVLGAPSTSTWYFVVAWHDPAANTINIQVNNGTANSASHSAGVFDGTSAFTIGAKDNATLFMDGLIDEVGFWKRLLTADEKTFLYNSGNGRAYADFAPNITTSSLPNGSVNAAYSETLAAMGGSGSITWSVSVGVLPTGLSLNSSTGEISGTPTVEGTFNFTVQAQDAALETDTQALSITVEGLPNYVLGTDGERYHKFQIECSVKDYDENIGFATLKNVLSDGYYTQTLYGSNTGSRGFNLTLPTLPSTGEIRGISGETSTREKYLWDLYCEHQVAGRPFVVESFRNGQYYLVRFEEELLSYKRFLTKLYSTGINLAQVRINGVSVFQPSLMDGLYGYWDSNTDLSSGDWDGTDGDAVTRTFEVTGDVIDAAGPNGQQIKRFNNTSNNAFVEVTGINGTIYDIILAVKFREATFSSNADLFSNTPDASYIKGTSAGTKFQDPSLTNFRYFLNGVEYASDDMQAPMNVWGVCHFRNLDGWDVGDGLRVGLADSSAAAPEMDLGDVIVLATPSLQDAREATEHLMVKFAV